MMAQPTRAVCIREVQRSLKLSSKLLIEDKIQALGLGKYFRTLVDSIECPGGGLIIFQGMQNHTSESIKSLEGFDIAWVEEAQAISQLSLDLLRPTLRQEGSELWFSWNPRSERDPVDVLLRGPSRIGPPDAIVVEANWRDNPWFPDVLREEMERDRRRDPEKYKHIWLGEYQRNSESRVFHNWSIEEFDTPIDARFYYGADWGFSVDPTVLVRSFIVGRTLYVDAEAYSVGVEIDRTPQLFDRIPGARLWPITADSSRPETISYMRRNGFPRIISARKGAGSVEDGIEFLKSFDIIVHPKCRHIIDELSLYSYKVDKVTNEVLPILDDKKNHVIDALRYAVEGVRRSAGEAGTARFVWR
jgi:phage terminase large subunit